MMLVEGMQLLVEVLTAGILTEQIPSKIPGLQNTCMLYPNYAISYSDLRL